jgi:hypothetical protein
MVMKEKIETLTKALLESAHARGTKQGVVVFERSLELLGAASSDGEVSDVLRKLNRALVGIEAHGDLTDQEFEWVRGLRRIEAGGTRGGQSDFPCF